MTTAKHLLKLLFYRSVDDVWIGAVVGAICLLAPHPVFGIQETTPPKSDSTETAEGEAKAANAVDAAAAQPQAEDAAPNAGLETGPMQKLVEGIQPILRIACDPKDLAIHVDRNSWGAKDDPKTQLASQIKALEKRGMDAATARRFAKHLIDQGQGSPLDLKFNELRMLGGLSSGTTSESGGRRSIEIHNQSASCAATITESMFSFRVEELENPNRMLIVRDLNPGLRITLMGNDMVATLTQTKSGLSGVFLSGETSIKGRAANLFEMRQTHPELLQRLLGVFRHAGVNFPPGPDEPAVIAEVLKRIQALQKIPSSKLTRLVKDLDSAQFTTREDASQQIRESYPQLESEIANLLGGEELSTEARRRLDLIVKNVNREEKTDPRVTQCLQQNGLLNSPGYLVGLLTELTDEQKTAVVSHLITTTGEDFGQDAKAWETWWDESRDKTGAAGPARKR